MYTLTVDETLAHLNAVLNEVGAPPDALVKEASAKDTLATTA